MRYVFLKLWHLIILLVVASTAVAGGFVSWPLYGFLSRYFRFAWFVILVGIAAHFAGNALPRKFRFENSFFSPHGWEDGGNFYQKRFGIRKWKDKLMNLGMTGFGKPVLPESGDRGSAFWYVLIQETCVAEVTHLALVFAGLFLLVLIEFPYSLFWTSVYIASNLLDIMIQRFNRPRYARIYRSALKHESGGAELR